MGRKIPKWNSPACLGLFLGFSNLHLSQVPLVLNVATDHISPQFHVIFDDKFETVHSLPLNTQWAWILQVGCKCYFNIHYDKNGDPILPSLSNIIKLYSDAKAMKPTCDPTPHIEVWRRWQVCCASPCSQASTSPTNQDPTHPNQRCPTKSLTSFPTTGPTSNPTTRWLALPDLPSACGSRGRWLNWWLWR